MVDQPTQPPSGADASPTSTEPAGKASPRVLAAAVVGLLALAIVLVPSGLRLAEGVGLRHRPEPLRIDVTGVDRIYIWAGHTTRVEVVVVDQPRGVVTGVVSRQCVVPPYSPGLVAPRADKGLLVVNAAPLYGIERLLTRCDTDVLVLVPRNTQVGVDLGSGLEIPLRPTMRRLVASAEEIYYDE